MSKKRVAVTLRKPQTPADVESFVGKEDAPAPAVVSATPENPIASAPEVQHGVRAFREITLYLPTELVRELSLYCMDRNCDVNRVVAEAVTEHVTGRASEPVASSPRIRWSGTLEAFIELLRVRLTAIYALTPLKR
jgi:hypothetical protein